MNTRKIAISLGLFLLVFALAAPAMLADEFDHATKLTFGQSVAIPGQVLPAGTYWFVRANHGENVENVMQVWDGDKKKVIATYNTGTVHQGKASGHVLLTMADRSPDPPALLDMTYPGTVNGEVYEFSYPANERKALSETRRMTMKIGSKGVIEPDVDAKK